MASNRTSSLAAILLAASACQFDRDVVGEGYYGPTQAGRGAMSGAVTATPSQGSQAAGRSAAGGDEAGSPASAGHAGAPSSPASPSSGGAAGTGATADVASGAGSACDLSGRWLTTVHTVTDALGQLQYAHNYLYFEIEQKGDALTITKGAHCGDDAIGVGAFAVTADFRAAAAGVASRVSYKGRTGSSVQAANGCKVELAKWYTVRGATNPHYLDPAVPLPTADQKAMDTTPGWEDWDGDGNPGITGVLSGVVAGKIFVAPRMWTSMSGTVPDVSSVFKLPVQWNQEPNVMSYDGSPLLASEASRAADPALHFAQFARLKPDQATGDIAVSCKSIVELARTLTPEAAGM